MLYKQGLKVTPVKCSSSRRKIEDHALIIALGMFSRHHYLEQ